MANIQLFTIVESFMLKYFMVILSCLIKRGISMMIKLKLYQFVCLSATSLCVDSLFYDMA